MKKVLISLSLIIVMMFSLIGCKSTKPDTNEGKNETISSEENLFNVKVTLPASLFEGTDKSTIETEGKAKGIHEVVVNDDGSVTYTMNKKTHKTLLDEMKKSVDESIKKALADKDTYPSFSKIEYNDDLTEFNIYVDASKYGVFESFSALGFYVAGNMYQAMNTVEQGNINTKVNFINKDTNEVIESGDSSKVGNAQ